MGISQDLGEFLSGFPWNEWGIFRRIGNAVFCLIDLFRTNVANISSAVKSILKAVFHFNRINTAKNAQVATSLLTSCNNLLQQADIRMRSHGLPQLVTTSLLQVVNRLVAR